MTKPLLVEVGDIPLAKRPNCCEYCRNGSLSVWVALRPTGQTSGWQLQQTVIWPAHGIAYQMVDKRHLP
jgi:hypothetical protein